MAPLALVLEASASCRPDQIVHLPEVLHHRAAAEGSARGSAHTAAVVERFLRRHGQPARVSPRPGGGHRLQWCWPASPPLVSVIIPSRDRVELLRRCLVSLERCRAVDPPMAWLLIDKLPSRTIGTTRYLWASCIQSVFLMQVDEQGRPWLAFNADVMKDMSTTS